MATVNQTFDYVVGVDTHARTHTLAVLHAPSGSLVAMAEFPTTPAGLRRAIAWTQRRAPGPTLAAVEGTSSYGASIAVAFAAHEITVAEVRPPTRAARAVHGKSDPIDAEAAARSVLGKDLASVATPRATGLRTALRVLVAARSLMDNQRTASRNALTALVRSTDLGIDARRPLTQTQIKAIAKWRTLSSADPVTSVPRSEAKRLALAVLALTAQLEDNSQQLHDLTESIAPGLQSTPGIGPVTGAIIVCAYSHHGRIRSEAAFAALGGVAPQQASSGNTTRHRLNRGGDRQLNRAFDTIVKSRMSYDTQTRDYVARSRAKGKTSRETRRCLKRYVCRAIYRQLQTCMA